MFSGGQTMSDGQTEWFHVEVVMNILRQNGSSFEGRPSSENSWIFFPLTLNFMDRAILEFNFFHCFKLGKKLFYFKIHMILPRY